jgi:hypothetical protein
MIGRYAVLAGRIRQDLTEVERIVQRVERAMRARQSHAADRDLFLDSAALNTHDCYSSLERLFEQIATVVDQSLPGSHDWHRELIRQMTVDVPGVRPPVLSQGTAAALDEYRRFRHVVRNVYAFELDPTRIEALTTSLRQVFTQASMELQAFADILVRLSSEA